MEFEIVNLLVDEKQVRLIKNVVETLTLKNQNLLVTPFKLGTIGDAILVSFKVDRDHHRFLLEKLAFNGIHTVNLDLKNKQQFDISKPKIKVDDIGEKFAFTNRLKTKAKEQKSLEQLISEGDYAEVLKIARAVTLPLDEIQKAKANIDSTIQNAINIAYSEAELKRIDIPKNLEKLIKIASDNNLKVMQKLDFIKNAGLKAIQLCIHNHDYVSDLITICNNNMLHNLINVKAAVSFYDVAVVNSDDYEEEILMAYKKLNTRWLLIAISSVEADLTNGEKESFYNLIDFISAKRS